MPTKDGPRATTRDLEHGDRDAITPSASSSLTPEEPRSKAATPTTRRSLEVEDAPLHRSVLRRRVWLKLETKLPAPVARCSRKVSGWLKGPEPPRTYRITPIFERVQTIPTRALARLPQWARLGMYLGGFVLWAVLFGVILTNYSLPTNFVGYGAPVPLSCVANLW